MSLLSPPSCCKLAGFSLSLSSKNMAALLVWTYRKIIRNFHSLDEHIAYNLGFLFSRLNPVAAYSGSIIFRPLNSDEEIREDGFLLMAVPKKRTSASKKKLRNRHKWLKNRSDIETCVVCGNFKLDNHLCGYCVKDVRRKTIEFRKEKNEGAFQWPIPEILRKFRA